MPFEYAVKGPTPCRKKVAKSSLLSTRVRLKHFFTMKKVFK